MKYHALFVICENGQIEIVVCCKLNVACYRFKVINIFICCILDTSTANSVDPDQTAPLWSSLIWFHTVKINLLLKQKKCSQQHFQLCFGLVQFRNTVDHIFLNRNSLGKAV